MGGNRQLRLHSFEQAEHRLRIQAVEGEAAPGMPPGLIGSVVEETHQIRGSPHHGNIRFIVEPLKELADVGERVDVLDLGIASSKECPLQCLPGAHMPRARRRRENLHAPNTIKRRGCAHPRSRLGGFALAGREFFEDSAGNLLQIAEPRQVFLKLMIEQLGVLRAELVSQNHVAQLDRVRQDCVFLEFFERLARIVVVHAASPLTSRAPSNAAQLLPRIVRKMERTDPDIGGEEA